MSYKKNIGIGFVIGAVASATVVSTSQQAMAQSDEFNGKLSSWMDLSAAPYNANGADSSDDTAAIQLALNALGGSGKKVLYIPNGTYYINQTLTMSAKSGVSILGQSRDGVKIVWRGAVGGTMMESQGNWWSRFGRITWDGQDGNGNKAGIIWWDWFKGERSNGDKAPGAGFAVTHNEHADEVFKDAGYGIRVGGKDVDTSYNQMDAETPVLRCKFNNLSTAGISIEDPNALDWFIWHGDFQNCAKGVTNNATPASNGGNFHVFYSKFANSSIADLSYGHTNFFSFRGNYSIGSAKFLAAEDYGTLRSSVLMQNNTILDSTSQPCVRIQNSGPLMMMNNKFRLAAGQATSTPMVAVGGGWPFPTARTLNGSGVDDTISIENQFSSSDPIVNLGRLRSINDTNGASNVSGTAPTIPDELPTVLTGTGTGQRPIQYISAASGTDITSTLQTAVNNAVPNAGKRPIIHIRDGSYNISQTITVPPNLDVQIIGDGFAFATSLVWTGTGVGPIFKLDGPNQTTIRDINISGGAKTVGGVYYPGAEIVWIGATNQTGERISMDQVNFDELLATGLPNTLVELHNSYNGGAKTAGLTADNSRINLYAGQLATNNLTFDVKNGGKLMAQDFWYETGANASSPATPGFMDLTGSGTLTLQNFLTSPVTTATTSAIKIDGFQGQVNLLGMSGVPGYSTNPFKTVVTSNSTSALSMLVMASTADTTTWFQNNSSSANIGFLNNKGADQKLPETGPGSASSPNDAFILNSLSQIKNELPSQWPLPAPLASSSKSDVRISRSFMQDSSKTIKVYYNNHGVSPTPTPTPTPTSPPGTGNGTGLTGQYFSDIALTNSVKTQVDPKVDFAWPGSPKNLDASTMNGVGPDNFSVRWTGQVQAIEAGAYTFQTGSDDGNRLWITDVNGNPLINDWNSHGLTYTTAPTTVTLTAGQKVNIKLEYYEEWAGAEIQLLWKRPGQTTFSIIPQTQLYPELVLATGTGLTGQYFNDLNLTTLVKTQVDSKVDFVWSGAPKNLDGSTMASVGPDNFSVRWTGQVQAIEAGAYTFQTGSDDGNRLWITDVNGTPLINDWNSHGLLYTTAPTTVTLAAGQKVNLKMEYFDEWGGAEVHLLWKSPGQSAFSVIPQSQLFPTVNNTGSITREVWTGITGLTVSSIPTSTPHSSTGTITSFEAPTNFGDTYGQRISGFLVPPTTGLYTFWIAGDDHVSLSLSSNSSPSNAAVIAHHQDWTNPREWNKTATQKSAPINLVAGQSYYIEALMKEDGAGDNLAVGWLKPGQTGTVPSEVIPGSALAPFPGR